MTQVTVFGGTGFLGRRIVERLRREGATLRVAVRHPDRVDTPATSIGSGRTTPVAADVRDPLTVAPAIAGAEWVVNAVSAYVETGGVTYTAVHVHGAGNIAAACQQQRVARLVHISGIGANPASSSKYIRTRGLGELAAQNAFPPATVLRPSVMFAINEGLLGALEKLARSTPIIPLIGGGRTRLQPVHVNDVSEAVNQSLRNPDAVGKTYELGGAETYTIREILDLVLASKGRSRRFISIPFALASPLARVLERFPGAPLTVAQVDLLRDHNVLGTGVLGFEELGITLQNLRDTISGSSLFNVGRNILTPVAAGRVCPPTDRP
jgi:NADH dehydrogenase